MATLTISQIIKAMELTLQSFREEGEWREREISSEILWNKILSCDIKVAEEEKTSDDEEVKIPKKRGRPPKKVVEEDKTSDDEPVADTVKIPKKRGRPPKKVVEEDKTSDDEPVADTVKIPKKRGRPPKKVVEEDKTSDDEPVADTVKIPKKRGRPPKKVVEEDKTSDDEPVVEAVKIPKKRGRPPKKVVEEEKTSDEEAVEDKKPVKPRAPKELIDFSSYGDLESLDWNKFVSNEGNSNKFWRATIQEQESEGKQVFRVLVHYGKIDSKGTCVQKTFESEDSSNEYLEKEIKSKTKKGYVSMNVE
jgi:predicted DNA-binding WGR domain protein